MTTYSQVLHKVMKYADTRQGQRVVFGGAVAVIVLAASIGGYFWYRNSMNERAQKAFADSMLEFEQALTGQEGISWADVERTFDTGSREFARSSFGPYFALYKADAALRQDKRPEAISAMREALLQLSSKNPLYYAYDTKLALMLVDSTDSAEHAEGDALLKKLADTTENNYRDMALYYLGFYARARGDQEGVKTYWQRLLQDFGSDSVWVEMVNAQRDFAV